MKNKYNNRMVSIIIPVYNSEKYIGEAIESSLNQTYEDIEIILIDDCSKDKSKEIIGNYVEKYGNVIYYLQEKNSGVAVARNKALELANGRYVAFLDSDDVWYENKLSSQIQLMDNKNASISYSAIEIIDEYGKLIKAKRNVYSQVDYNILLKNTMIATSSVVIDRNIMGEFKMPLLRSGQDYATWLMLMRDGRIAYGINEAMVKYRKTGGSLSSNKLESVKQVRNIQISNEKIGKIAATFNSVCFAVNALKKHYL